MVFVLTFLGGRLLTEVRHQGAFFSLDASSWGHVRVTGAIGLPQDWREGNVPWWPLPVLTCGLAMGKGRTMSEGLRRYFPEDGLRVEKHRSVRDARHRPSAERGQRRDGHGGRANGEFLSVADLEDPSGGSREVFGSLDDSRVTLTAFFFGVQSALGDVFAQEHFARCHFEVEDHFDPGGPFFRERGGIFISADLGPVPLEGRDPVKRIFPTCSAFAQFVRSGSDNPSGEVNFGVGADGIGESCDKFGEAAIRVPRVFPRGKQLVKGACVFFLVLIGVVSRSFFEVVDGFEVFAEGVP